MKTSLFTKKLPTKYLILDVVSSSADRLLLGMLFYAIGVGRVFVGVL